MMNDLISRQAAIDMLMKEWKAYKDYPYVSHVKHGLEIAIALIENKLPSAQPEQGKWIKDGEAYALYKCSACNEICPEAGSANCIKKEQMYKTFKFCPHCGAKMEEQE